MAIFAVWLTTLNYAASYEFGKFGLVLLEDFQHDIYNCQKARRK